MRFIILILLLIYTTAISADQTIQTNQLKKGTPTTNNTDPLDNFNFAIGIGLEKYSDPYIVEASINGSHRIVTIDKETKHSPSLWLVTNWTADKYGSTWIKPGIYLGVKVLGNESTALDGLSLGVNAAFLRKGIDGNKRKSFNIGLGYVTHRTRQLADGITEGQALPADFDDIKYKEKTEGSWMIMFSTDIF